MRLSNVLSPGDKIDILMEFRQRRDDGVEIVEMVLRSSVMDDSLEEGLEIAMPVQRGGKTIILQVGAEGEFLFYTKKGMYKCRAVVSDRYRRDNIPLLVVKARTELKKVQRREFYRIDYVEMIQFSRIPMEASSYSTAEDIGRLLMREEYVGEKRTGFILDLSGGGIRFTSTEWLDSGEHVYLELPLRNGSETEMIPMVCEVISSAGHTVPGEFCIRGRFVYDNSTVQDRVIRFVFEQERKIRSKEVR